jgi:hypothetical protein
MEETLGICRSREDDVINERTELIGSDGTMEGVVEGDTTEGGMC